MAASTPSTTASSLAPFIECARNVGEMLSGMQLDDPSYSPLIALSLAVDSAILDVETTSLTALEQRLTLLVAALEQDGAGHWPMQLASACLRDAKALSRAS